MASRFHTAISVLSDQAGQAALDLVFPPVCRLCGVGIGRSTDFCGPCQAALTASEPMMAATCPRCGRPRPTSAIGADDEDSVNSAMPGCPRCQRESYHFDRVIPLWAYRDQVRRAVVAAKYSHQSPLADALGRRLAVRVDQALGSQLPSLVTFVPSHLTRQLSRGGNGNLTIATAVAMGIGCPCGQRLRITRRIEKQAWLEESERAKNVRGAFAAKKSYALLRSRGISNQQQAGRHVLVVDDVLTTGATANEVAKVLKDGGAIQVTIAVVARAVS